ncbi:MAG: plasmid mobilization relaxosome protein MobC [Ruminococcus sp.]|nr:plasmid mobilization relaxosome protein MobC [Ruminococcus sp.]
MGRIRTERIEIRVTPDEKNMLKNYAEKSRMNMSNYILKLAEQKKIYSVDGIPELIRQIIRIGTNVNQIVMVANTNKSVSEKQIQIVNSNLEHIQKLLGDMIDVIKNSDDEVEI